MGLFQFDKEEDVLEMFTKLSLFKQKIYCNIDNVVYMKSIRNIPEIQPKIQIDYKIISCVHDLLEHKSEKVIAKNLKKFRYFLLNGCKIYIALHNKTIVGHYLLCKLSNYKPYLYLSNPLFEAGFKNNNYCIYFCHTLDEYQKKGIYSYMLTQICGDILNEGGNVFISTSRKNIASHKGIEKAGFKQVYFLKYKEIKYITTKCNLIESIDVA